MLSIAWCFEPCGCFFPRGNAADRNQPEAYRFVGTTYYCGIVQKRHRRYFRLRWSDGYSGLSFPLCDFIMTITAIRSFIVAWINSGFSGVLWTPEVRGSR